MTDVILIYKVYAVKFPNIPNIVLLQNKRLIWPHQIKKEFHHWWKTPL